MSQFYVLRTTRNVHDCFWFHLIPLSRTKPFSLCECKLRAKKHVLPALTALCLASKKKIFFYSTNFSEHSLFASESCLVVEYFSFFPFCPTFLSLSSTTFAMKQQSWESVLSVASHNVESYDSRSWRVYLLIDKCITRKESWVPVDK